MNPLILLALALGLLGGCVSGGVLIDAERYGLGSVLLIGGIFIEILAIVSADQASRIMVWLITLVAIAACAPPAHAAEPINLERLRDVLCDRMETPGAAFPALAIGDGGNSRGECQLGVGTARLVIPFAVERGMIPGYMIGVAGDDDALKAMLHLTRINRPLALAYLEWMHEGQRAADGRHWRRWPIRTIEGLAYAFNGGHNSDFAKGTEALAYARTVQVLYAGPPPAARAKQLTAGN